MSKSKPKKLKSEENMSAVFYDASSVTVREPVIDRLSFTVPWGIGAKWSRDHDEDKRFKKIEKGIKKAVKSGHVQALWRDPGSRYRLCTRIPLPSGQKAFAQFIAKEPLKMKGGLRVELNPSKLGPQDLSRLRTVLRQIIGDAYDTLLVDARVTRMDMAVDVEGVTI